MAAPLDPTFRNYDIDQAAAYALHRGTYAPRIIREVVSQHTRRGGACGTVLDVGCGTGNATRHLASYFDHAVGCDAGKEMIAQATEAGGRSKNGSPIVYEVVEAEQLDRLQGLAAGSVDLLTAAMSAHWFRMDEFWHQAVRMVKPGGTIAVWTMSSFYCPVQQALSHLEDDILGPYELPQNRLSRCMYASLTMPWMVSRTLATEFPRALFTRHEWNRDGHLEPGEEDFFDGPNVASFKEIAAGLGTASMVTRWRESHPELVGTDEDCVGRTMKAVAEALGVSAEDGEAVIGTGSATTLLVFTRSSELSSGKAVR